MLLLEFHILLGDVLKEVHEIVLDVVDQFIIRDVLVCLWVNLNGDVVGRGAIIIGWGEGFDFGAHGDSCILVIWGKATAEHTVHGF